MTGGVRAVARRFVDDSIPAGVTTLTYQVQAVRTNAVGVAAQFNVSFGVDAETARRRAATPSFQRAPSASCRRAA